VDSGGWRVGRPSVFISYTSHDDRDRATARRLAGGLRELGADVWIAPGSIPPGDEWRESLIREVLSKATHFLVLLSTASVTADWVLTEIALARDRYEGDLGFRVLPLVTGLLGDYPGREFIDRFQRVPYRDAFPALLDEVVRAVGVTSPLPAGMTELITEKTQSFVGRDYVFAAIEDFIASAASGYFTIEGDPGAGKTAILAEYVRRTGCVAHFNIRSQSLNTSGYFIQSLGSHLAARYGIPAPSQGGDRDRYGQILGRMVADARSAVPTGESLVIVVDALDEVNSSGDPPGTNVLFLPSHLPAGVYFLLSSRHTEAPLHADVPVRTYDLARHQEDTMADVREYLRRMAGQERLRTWLNARSIPLAAFIAVLADKSEGNFMYLRHVLPELGNGRYRDFDIEELPQGLEQYYESHWRLMALGVGQASRLKVWVIYLLCEFGRPVSTGVLARVLREVEPTADAIAVQEVLGEWRQFLHRDAAPDGARFSLYHASFRDFLHRKDIIASAGLVLRQVNGVIADMLWDYEFGQG
jgi:hypothetical protein